MPPEPKKRGRKKGIAKTPGSGRKKGTPNKATADVKALAQVYGATAIETLAKLMTDKEAPDSIRRAAAVDLLDRGYGKPTQAIDAKLGLPSWEDILATFDK